MSSLVVGILIGYVIGTAGMLVTMYLARGSSITKHATASGIPAP